MNRIRAQGGRVTENVRTTCRDIPDNIPDDVSIIVSGFSGFE